MLTSSACFLPKTVVSGGALLSSVVACSPRTRHTSGHQHHLNSTKACARDSSLPQLQATAQGEVEDDTKEGKECADDNESHRVSLQDGRDFDHCRHGPRVTEPYQHRLAAQTPANGTQTYSCDRFGKYHQSSRCLGSRPGNHRCPQLQCNTASATVATNEAGTQSHTP